MILIALDMHGRATVVDPSPIAQGTDSESIVLLSPFPVRCPVMMGWVMPDGSPVEIPLDDTENSPKTRYWNMTNVVLSEGYDGNVQSVWTFKPTANLTAQYGTALVCFYVQKPVQSEDPLTHTTIQGYKSLTYNPVEVYVTETLNPIPDGDLDPESPLLEQILSAITYYNSYLTDIAENGVSTVFDTLDEEQRKVYTDAVATLGSLHLITSDAVAQVFNEAKDYAATKDTETLNAAKSYTNTQLIPYATKEYADEKATAAGAAAVVSANGYTDTKATQTLNSAESYTDGKVTIINEKIERLEGRVLYATWDTGRWKLPVGCFTTGNHYTLICRIPTDDYNTHVTSNAEPPIQCGDTQYTTGYKLVTLRGGRFPLIGTSYFDDLRYYEVEAPGAIMVSPDYHYFVFSGIAYDNPNDLYQVWFLVDKKIAKLSFGTINDYDLIPGSVFKYLSQIVSSNTAAISTNRASITDDRLRIANLENSLYDFVLGKDVEAFPALKNAILPSAITVDNTVYPIADGANGILSSVKGNTKQFNQLMRNISSDNFFTFTGADVSWGTHSVTLTATQRYGGQLYSKYTCHFIKGHIYLFLVEIQCEQQSGIDLRVANVTPFGSASIVSYSNPGNNYKKLSKIKECVKSSNVNVIIQNNQQTDWLPYTASNLMVFDLTAMGLDSITTVDEFTALYPKSYYPYNAETLYDSVISGLALTGKNLWDEQWELGRYNPSTGEVVESTTNIRNKNSIKVIGGSTIYVKCSALVYVFCYDVDNDLIQVSFIQNGTITLSPVIGNKIIDHINFYISSEYGTTYNNDICINVSDASFNGQYAPYALHTISLPSTQTLGGVGTAQDEIQVTKNTNDDYYTIKKIKRVESVDLGTKTWQRFNAEGTTTYLFAAQISGMDSSRAKILSNSIYTINNTAVISNLSDLKMMSGPSVNYIYIRDDSFSDASTFKSSLSGVMLTYELATPVETTLTETATLAEVSAIRENGGMISVVGNTNEDYAQPDVSEYVTYEKADLSGGN